MKTVTLRNIDPELKKALMDKAAQDSSSLNSVVLNALRESFGIDKKPRRQRNLELENLAGAWNDEDKAEFEKNTSAFNEIDEAMWQ
ncbi:MAG: hypothetical protein QM496_12375 [Verrucomicrobiota bacterium]